MSKVEEQLKREISDIIQHELKDPRLGFVTVLDVNISSDLRFAKVLVSVYGDEEIQTRTRAGLASATKFVRAKIGDRLSLRYTPELTFVVAK